MRFDLLKVLLVDDNQHMRLLLTEILRALGVRHIFEALNGIEALEMMHRVPIDIVITDLKMGALDGIEFVNQLRRAPDSPDPFAPVIMITGYSTSQRVKDARDAGVNEFLTKPVTARGLINRLTLLIEQPRAYVRCDTYFGPDRRRQARSEHKGPWRRAEDAIAV